MIIIHLSELSKFDLLNEINNENERIKNQFFNLLSDEFSNELIKYFEPKNQYDLSRHMHKRMPKIITQIEIARNIVLSGCTAEVRRKMIEENLKFNNQNPTHILTMTHIKNRPHLEIVRGGKQDLSINNGTRLSIVGLSKLEGKHPAKIYEMPNLLCTFLSIPDARNLTDSNLLIQNSIPFPLVKKMNNENVYKSLFTNEVLFGFGFLNLNKDLNNNVYTLRINSREKRMIFSSQKNLYSIEDGTFEMINFEWDDSYVKLSVAVFRKFNVCYNLNGCKITFQGSVPPTKKQCIVRCMNNILAELELVPIKNIKVPRNRIFTEAYNEFLCIYKDLTIEEELIIPIAYEEEKSEFIPIEKSDTLVNKDFDKVNDKNDFFSRRLSHNNDIDKKNEIIGEGLLKFRNKHLSSLKHALNTIHLTINTINDKKLKEKCKSDYKKLKDYLNDKNLVKSLTSELVKKLQREASWFSNKGSFGKKKDLVKHFEKLKQKYLNLLSKNAHSKSELQITNISDRFENLDDIRLYLIKLGKNKAKFKEKTIVDKKTNSIYTAAFFAHILEQLYNFKKDPRKFELVKLLKHFNDKRVISEVTIYRKMDRAEDYNKSIRHELIKDFLTVPKK